MLIGLLLVWMAVGLVAWKAPRAGERFWRVWSRMARILVRRRILLFGLLIVLPMLLRALLLPLWPIPAPYVQDEFSYLLQADTFAHGRVANPSHPLGEFFESGQILVRPSYASKYPPAHSLMMAIGQRLFGHPWFGVWLSCGLLLAAIYWALEGWLPAQWAMFGVLLALPLCSASYWMNSYMGGSVAALGGALVLGAFPRLARRKQPGAAWLLSVGVLILMFSRPYEGLLVCVPVFAACLYSRVTVWAWARIAAVGIVGVAMLGFYNERVAGSPLRLPHTEYESQYLSSRVFTFQALGSPKQFRYDYMRILDEVWERRQWENAHRLRFLIDRPLQWIAAAGMFAGGTGAFLPLVAIRASAVEPGPVLTLANTTQIFLKGAMVMLPVFFFVPARRTRLVMIVLACAVLGSFVSAPFYQHYEAPALAALLVVVSATYWRLRVVNPTLAILLPVAAIGMSLLDGVPEVFRTSAISAVSARGRLEDSVKSNPGRHLIIVRYSGGPLHPIEEWVYNGADIDGQQVVWAHDLGPLENRRLTGYFKDRSVWLFQPNVDPEWIAPYKE
jgi:hypothetical protein